MAEGLADRSMNGKIAESYMPPQLFQNWEHKKFWALFGDFVLLDKPKHLSPYESNNLLNRFLALFWDACNVALFCIHHKLIYETPLDFLCLNYPLIHTFTIS